MNRQIDPLLIICSKGVYQILHLEAIARKSHIMWAGSATSP